jgi:hypothetical protein
VPTREERFTPAICETAETGFLFPVGLLKVCESEEIKRRIEGA